MALAVTSFDLCLKENGEKHHTDEYEDNFVVRRGASFSLKINHEGFDEKANKFYFELRRSGDQTTEISFQVTSKVDKCINVSVFIPVKTLVSSYQLVLVNSFGETKKEYANTVYVIFNPWNKDDEVYIEDEDLKKEYVLSDSGWVYWSNYNPKNWNFAQFTDEALKCTFKLLESAANPESRDAAHKVARHMSAMSSSEENNGLLVGKWPKKGAEEEPYKGGKKPWEWTGSQAIFKQYLETGESVKFGQCWVFSGLYTSMMRCLGIPCRSVTNYRSAVDKNGNLMIDIVWDHKDNLILEECDKFIWTFHVWNDVWMMRPDLPAGLGGWQAVDGCPQELSDGLHQCGPASLAAIKEGNVKLPHDTGFLFASVNADEYHYVKDIKGEKKVYSSKTDSIGWWIITKTPNKWEMGYCTNDYKYDEYSMEERAAMMHALRKVNSPVTEKQAKDITFWTKASSNVSYDDPIEVKLTAANDSTRELTVSVTVVPYVISYNGAKLKELTKLTAKKVVKGKSDDTIKFDINVKESLCKEFLHENVSIRFALLAKVEETKQYYAHQDVCNIERPTATLKVEMVDNAEGKVKSNDTMKVKITLPKVSGIDKFTDCSMDIDSPLVKATAVELNDSEVNSGVLEKSFQIKPIKKAKESVINVIFNSKEISGVHGSMHVSASI